MYTVSYWKIWLVLNAIILCTAVYICRKSQILKTHFCGETTTKYSYFHTGLSVHWQIMWILCYGLHSHINVSTSIDKTISSTSICPRWCCPWVRGGGDFSNAADAVAENDQWRVPPGVSGPGAHSARPGGTLPLPEGQRPEARQEEGQGQEDEEEMRTRPRTI